MKKLYEKLLIIIIIIKLFNFFIKKSFLSLIFIIYYLLFIIYYLLYIINIYIYSNSNNKNEYNY
jgi:hypothetical protein